MNCSDGLSGSGFSIPEVLAIIASRHPDGTAIEAPGRPPMLHEGLGRLLSRLGSELRQLGVDRKTRIGLVLPSGPENAVAFLAAASHAVCVPFNPETSSCEWEALFEESRLDCLFTYEGFCPAAGSAAEALGVRLLFLTHDVAAPAGTISLTAPPATAARASTNSHGPADENEITLLIRTSGSTARPRWVPLHHGSLVRTALATAKLLDLGPEDRCLHMLSFFHVHGLVSCVLVPLLTGGSVAVTGGYEKDSVSDWMRTFQPTWYSAAPVIHRAVLEHFEQANCEDIGSLRFIRSGAVAINDETRERIESTLGVTLIEAYGATEAPQVSCNPIGATKAGSVGISVGPEIRIADEQGTMLPVGEQGEILLRGETLFRGYDGSAMRNGWFRTGDLGRLDEEGYLYVTGRLKEMINRGGQKIAPLEVDAILLAHPSVREAIAFAAPHPTLGEDLLAAIVPEFDRAVDELELRRFVLNRLPGFKVPSRILVLDKIPCGPTGKPIRIGLHGLLADQLNSEFSEPVGETECLVAEELSKVLGMDRLGREDNFFCHGGDSLRGQAAMARIAERLVLELAPGLLFMFPTVASLSGELMQGKQKVGRTEFDQVQQSSGLTVSKQEEQFWLLNRMSGELGTYQPLAAIRCSGGVSVERLREAVGAVVRKYEIFRTVYRESADRLKPMVQANVEAPVSHLASPHGVELDEWAAEHLQQAARCKFNLATDVPLRVFFYSGDDGRSVIGFVFQHIAMDGLSFPLLWESLAQAYRDPDFDDDPAGSYRAYAQRQETRLQPDRLAAMRLFWHEHLQGNSAALDLPFDGLGTDSCEAYQQLQTIPAEVSEGLSRVARSNACSENSLYLAAYFAWLARYTNHESAVVGLPVSIRPDTADKDVIGCCINTICLSQPVSPTTRFSELVGAIQKLMAAALPHAEYPIARLTGELCRHSGEDRRLFQTLFQYRYFRRELAGLEDEGAEMIPLSESITDLPLTMEIVPPSSGPAQVAIMVNTACFSPGTAGRMLEHFCCLLRSIATNPDQEIRQYELVSSEERRRLLFEFNQTARLHDTEPNLWLRTRSALLKRSGESVVRFDGTHSDGPELVRRAEAIAAGLQQHGVRIGDRVGIYLNRSLDLVPALLGILANGAAYVPLDPESPVERNRFILADADVAVLLSENQLRDQLPQCECPVLCLESIESKDRFQAVSIGKNDLAYILYTSGSTGRPKGVAVEHGNVLNLLEAMAEAPGFKPGDRLLALTTICFDISVVELFLPLVKGGVVIVGREQLRLDPPELARTMMSEAVSIFQATPATYEMLCHSGWKPGPELKLYCGGEALSPRLADQLLANGASLWNIYGPTEATVYALGKRILPAERILIGRPLANMEAYVVDAAGMLAPTGVAGELLVGGQGVARGYWKRDELTADRFIRLELEGLPARRVYRTGDRARVLSNGEVEFLGRQDRQIKIRGHRIELGEIEQCLRRLSGVQRVIVEVRPSTAGDPRLVAYVAPRLLKQRQRELADSLAASLPSYMLPSAWFFLDDFPLTPNRKIDTSRLPSPKDATENESARPTTDLEKSIERIWAELLGVNSIGLDDNFFELGGHSLLAVRLVSRMETELRRPISLNLLFRHATIRKLGAAIESVATVNSTLVPLRNGAGPPVYFVHGFTGHVLGHIDFVKHFPEGLQVVGVQAVEHVGEPRQESFESMGARYARDICEHQPDGPIYLCGYSLGGLIAFETARQLLSLGRKIGGVVVLDTATRNLPRFVYYRGLSAYLIRRAFHHARCMISAPEGIFSFLRGRCRAMLNRLRRTPAAPTAQNPNQPAPVDPYQRVGFRYFPQPAEIAVSVLITGQYPELVRATWRYLAGGGVSENRHDALHLELLQDADLARELGRSLLEMRSVSD